jgi:hypothetical protein
MPFDRLRAIFFREKKAKRARRKPGASRRASPRRNDFRRPGILDGSRTQAVETVNGFVIGIVDCKERLRAAQIVTPAGIAAQEFIQCLVAAIESAAIMFLADRLFVPARHDYGRFGSARAAATSFAFGAGGWSSSSRTRKLSRADSRTRSASSITALAASKA